jgi:hypothetical protein|tara:strand:- start:3611 stop:4051 length:441 start_codon:yes stop_codon:yes gene_type:complete
MKRGKEISLKLPYEYNIISGTVDNKQPKSIYIQISAWGKPKNIDGGDYDSLIKQKSKRIKRKLFEVLSQDEKFYNDKCVVDFNMASSGISYDKRSFMSVEVTLYQKEPLIQINSELLYPKLADISSKLIRDVFESDEDFTFFRRKS